MTQLFTLLADISLGAAAIKVAWSADRATAQLTVLLKELTSRVEALEDSAPKAKVVRKRKGRGI